MTLVENDWLTIHAPMAGILRPLGKVPDAAFAGRLVGDGVAIDPLDAFVRAPFSGIVTMVAGTSHAVTVRSENGVEVLMHVGIDSIRLNGCGFKPMVQERQPVLRGDVLIAFDIDLVGRKAQSLLSPMILVSGHRFRVLVDENCAVRAGDVLLLAEMAPKAMGLEPGVSVRSTAHAQLALGLPNGLHARPSGQVAQLARTFDGVVTIAHNGRIADAASVTALMALGTRLGSEIEIRAVGERPREVVVALANLLHQLADTEQRGGDPTQFQRLQSGTAVPAIVHSSSAIPAVVASPGLAVGPVFRVESVDLDVSQSGCGAEAEQVRLDKAIACAADQLSAVAATSHGAAKAIAQAHRDIVQDSALLSAARHTIAGGAGAGFAWRCASRAQEAALAATGDARLMERRVDLRDIERRVLALLAGVEGPATRQPPPGSILLCDDITPSLLLEMAGLGIAGLCTARGGATSHAALLAAAGAIPMLVAAGDRALALEEGRIVLLDAETGRLDPSPTPEALQRVADRQALRATQADSTRSAAQEPCRLADGTRIEVCANLATFEDACAAIEQGAEGCGLLRTEFLFSQSCVAPGEESQRDLYGRIADALQGRPLIIRTLDIGGDKPLDYLPFPREDNPALGMRGIRFALAETSILRTQLRAMVQGVPHSQLRIMLPMIVEADEIIQVRAMLQSECRALGIAGDIQIGIMIETPAAALLADQLAAHADFLSIGSNDLSQYVLAMDRGNAPLASRVDACHPAVLRAIDMAARGASRHGRWLGICGGLASDHRAAPLLVGLGCQELSAVPGAIARIKQRLRGWTLDDCRALAQRALAQDSAAAVRALIEGVLP